ncbi:MAG: UDP binding domain-containing protein, partial [Bacteroides sp.]
NIDDLRESPSMEIAEILRDKGYKIIACEPNVKEKLVNGFELYSLEEIIEKKIEIMSALKEIYRTPVLPPYLGRSAATIPASPTNIRINGTNLSWEEVKDTYYAVYKHNGNNQVASLVGTTKERTFKLTEKGTYFVTAVNKNNAESEESSSISY